MDSNLLWNKRFKAFYRDIIRYFSIIAMSVLYSFILFGSAFIYYYVKILEGLPPDFPTELVAALFTAWIFLQTHVRTFLKKADTIFLPPAEAKFSSYFKKSFIYSAWIDGLKFFIVLLFIRPLVREEVFMNGIFLILFAGLLVLNLRLTWIEQWLTTRFQLLTHRSIRFLSFSIILYFLFIDVWTIAGILLLAHYVLWFHIFNSHPKRINWDFLMYQEERALTKIYTFIHLYTDVPHLKHSFKPRKLISWVLKKGVAHKQSSAYGYLFALLFSRSNEFYRLYVRLTLIGCAIVYFLPMYGWLVIFPVLFFTGYQLLPLQHMLNDHSRIYPIATVTMKNSFKKLLLSLSIIQLLLLNVASLGHLYRPIMLVMIPIEVLFIYWFVYVFLAKRISS